jgi:CRISPR/Cas system-associated endonuclease Cas1
MSRYCGPDNSEPILRAAAEWREKALINAGSVFSVEQLWTTPNIESIQFIEAQAAKAYWGAWRTVDSKASGQLRGGSC